MFMLILCPKSSFFPHYSLVGNAIYTTVQKFDIDKIFSNA